MWFIELRLCTYFLLKHYIFLTKAIYNGSASTVYKLFKIIFYSCTLMQWRHQKFKLTVFLTESLHSVNNPVLKYFCKFQLHLPLNARGTAIQSSENLHTSSLQQPGWWAKECPPAHFPYNIIENSPASLAYNSALVGQNNVKFGIKSRCMIL